MCTNQFDIDIIWSNNMHQLLIKNPGNDFTYYIDTNIEKLLVKKSKYIVYFNIKSIYVAKHCRKQKIAYKLFHKLCEILFIHFGWNVRFVLDDSSGTDFRNNIYAKLNFWVLNNNRRWVRPIKFAITQYKQNPCEKRFAHMHRVYLAALKKILNNK